MIGCGHVRWIISLVVLSCFGGPRGNPFPRVGEVRLNDRLVAKGQAPIQSMSVFALSFSPHGDRLAIQFGDDIDRDVVRVGHAKREYLFVLSTGEGNPTIKWTELSQRTVGGAGRSELAWSPDGDALVLVNYHALIHIPGGDACRLPGGFRGFLRADQVLLTIYEPGPAGVTTFAVADSHCGIQERWPTDRRLIAASVSPDGEQLAIIVFDHLATIDLSRSHLLLLPVPLQTAAELDLARAKRIRTKGSAMNGLFFTGGAVCAPFGVNIPIPALDGGTLNGTKMKVECWDAQSGKSIHQTQPLWSRGDLVVSAGGGRIAVSDSGTGHDHFTELANEAGVILAVPAKPSRGAAKPVPQLRGVWDVHTGKMLGLWSPDPEMHSSVTIQPTARRAIAISVDGKVLAESGDDSVLLYRLP